MGLLPTDEELLTAVGEAGWLLEHNAVRVLDAAEMHPRAGWAFQDPDEPTKSRELDVWSYRQILADEGNKVYVTARFLVECKQSANPYVGVGYDMPDHSFQENPTSHVLPQARVEIAGERSGTIRYVPAWSHYGFQDLSREHFRSNFRVTQLTRLDRRSGGTWEANNASIFTGLVYPLAKALLASKEPIVKGRDRLSDRRTTWVEFALHFPVVLISCPLYVVDATRDTPVVAQRPWVTARRELKSANVEGSFEMDIATVSAFASYVADRLAFASKFAAVIEADPLKYIGESQPPS